MVPRYLSYLLVPFSWYLRRDVGDLRASCSRPALRSDGGEHRGSRTTRGRFVALAPEVIREPREAYKDAAAVIEAGEAR